MVGFSDSDYASYVDNKKNPLKGYIFMMAEGVVKQTLIASYTKAKYVVCYKATCHAIWFQNFISVLEVVHSIFRLLKLFSDNSATVSFFRNTRSTHRSKHIDVKLFFVKRKVVESLISIEYTPMTSMLADPLTKGLSICVF